MGEAEEEPLFLQPALFSDTLGTEGAKLLVFPLPGTHFPLLSTLRAQPATKKSSTWWLPPL